jgi:hypothetical protein
LLIENLIICLQGFSPIKNHLPKSDQSFSKRSNVK